MIILLRVSLPASQEIASPVRCRSCPLSSSTSFGMTNSQQPQNKKPSRTEGFCIQKDEKKAGFLFY